MKQVKNYKISMIEIDLSALYNKDISIDDLEKVILKKPGGGLYPLHFMLPVYSLPHF